jgi:hypothetical protein
MLLGPPDHIGIEFALIVVQDGDPGAQLLFLVIGERRVQPGGELAQRRRKRSRKEDDLGPVSGLADVTMRLAAIVAGAKHERVRARPLTDTWPGDTRSAVGMHAQAQEQQRWNKQAGTHGIVLGIMNLLVPIVSTIRPESKPHPNDIRRNEPRTQEAVGVVHSDTTWRFCRR